MERRTEAGVDGASAQRYVIQQAAFVNLQRDEIDGRGAGAVVAD